MFGTNIDTEFVSISDCQRGSLELAKNREPAGEAGQLAGEVERSVGARPGG
jgi:hypothetical protein